MATQPEEVTIVLTGKSGAGKTVLFKNLFGEKVVPVLSARPTTKQLHSKTIVKDGVTVRVFDTPGLIFSTRNDKRLQDEAKQAEEELLSLGFDLLIYCLPARSEEVIAPENKQIMKYLQDNYGSDIWKHCVIVLTFSNLILGSIKSDHEPEQKPARSEATGESNAHEESRKIGLHPAVVKKYKYTLFNYLDEFRRELASLGVDIKDVNPKTIFHRAAVGNHSQDVTLAIPAGLRKDEMVIPGIPLHGENWVEELYSEMIKKSKENSQKILARHLYHKDPSAHVTRVLSTSLRYIQAGVSGVVGAGGVLLPAVVIAVVIGGAAGGPVGIIVGGVAVVGLLVAYKKFM